MPVPDYFPFRQKVRPLRLDEVTGGMSPREVLAEIERGARFVIYPYVVSVLIVTYKRQSRVYFLRPGNHAFRKAIPYAMLSAIFGWWRIPWGLLHTPGTIYEALRGGTDITPNVKAKLQAYLEKDLQQTPVPSKSIQ